MSVNAGKADSPSILHIWEAAVSLYGTNSERPLQIVIRNTAPDGEPFFLLSVLPRQSVPSLVPMTTRVPLDVKEADVRDEFGLLKSHFGSVSVIRGDILEAEFGVLINFLSQIQIDGFDKSA